MLTNISPEDLRVLDQKEAQAVEGCYSAIKWLYDSQGWTPERISRRILGLKASTWRKYSQKSHASRSLHSLAALSWLGQVSMSVFYLGTDVHSFWPGASNQAVEISVCTGVLPANHFELFVKTMFQKLNVSSNATLEKIELCLSELTEFEDSQFLMPQRLDLMEFKLDYHQAIAIGLRHARKKYGLTTEQVSWVLNVSQGVYESYESPGPGLEIPASLAMRLKFGFRLDDTASLLAGMQKYKGFYYARKVQQIREQIIFTLYDLLDAQHRLMAVELARSLMSFHLK